MSLQDKLAALGWVRLEGADRHKRVGTIAPHGDAQLRKGPCLVSLSNGSLYWGKRGAEYYDEAGLVLNALVVDKGHRGQGLARAAMADLVSALEGTGGTLYVEACSIGGVARGLTDAQLLAWYQRQGFATYAGGGQCCLRREFPEEGTDNA